MHINNAGFTNQAACMEKINILMVHGMHVHAVMLCTSQQHARHYLGVSDTVVSKCISREEAGSCIDVPRCHFSGWDDSRRVQTVLSEGCDEHEGKVREVR